MTSGIMDDGEGRHSMPGNGHTERPDDIRRKRRSKCRIQSGGKEERGNRIFPVSDKSQDVLNVFEKKLKKEGVNVKTNTKVKEILIDDKKVAGVLLESGERIYADKIILATGGKSYPNTGSTRRWI
jgi:predicted flavoprotein YhiN